MANGTLVAGEYSAGALSKGTLEALAAARGLAAGPVELVLVGAGAASDESAFAHGADAVLAMDRDLSVEEAVAAVAAAAAQREPRYVLGAKDFAGGAMARIAYRLGTALASDCTALALGSDGHLLATRPVYGGSAVATVRCVSVPAVASLRAGAYDPLPADHERVGERVDLDPALGADVVRVKVVERHERPPEGVRLEDARVIVSGGRGLGGPESFEQLEALARLLKGAVGASRAACDAGWVPSSYQIGLTGKSVTPDLYIAIGISGASQHLAGISGARDIVAINKDAGAAIFKEARFGVAGDWAQVLPAFMEQLHELLDDTTEGG